MKRAGFEPGWQLIGTAPRDGTTIWLRRLYQGRLVWQGQGFHGFIASAALPRLGVGDDPFDRDAEGEEPDTGATSGWVTADGMHCPPTPTHWWNGDDDPPPP
jgi:hypothetical protein